MCIRDRNNLPLMQQHWSNVLDNNDSTKVEKASARGFLCLWETDGEQQRLTGLMLDLLKYMEKLQTVRDHLSQSLI